MSEKRRFSRVPFDAETHLLVGGRKIPCRLLDISVKGALVELPEKTLISIGTPAKLHLNLNNDDAVIRMDVAVAHVTNNKAGFYCQQIDSDSMTHLRRLIELNLGDPELFNRELRQLGDFGNVSS